jgi:putative hydrolase of the HAD superfamily
MKSSINNLLQPMEPFATDTEARLTPLPGIRAVLFDIYGTLLISGSGDVGSAQALDNTEALAAALSAVGADAGEAASGIAEFFNVVRADHQVLKANGVDHPEIEVRDVWRRIFPMESEAVERLAIEYECRANPVWPMPGFINVLHTLRAEKFALGIVSNAQFYTPLILETLVSQSLTDLGFDEELCAWSYQQRCAKPSPSLFSPVLQRLKELHIEPSQTLYVGNDMLNDIHTASQCGLRTALFAGDRRSLRLRADDPRCTTLQPDAIITRLNQLPSLFPAP